MNAPTPHYLVCLEAGRSADSGRWRFSLRTPDGSEQFEVADVEPKIRGDRLDLLTVVRALESLDQPSQVTLIGCSPYIRQGMQYGLPEWRCNGWRWEFFGQMVPVKNGDLWQRLDRALRFHQVECRQRRFDMPHTGPDGPHPRGETEKNDWGVRVAAHGWLRYAGSLLGAHWRRRITAAVRFCLQRAKQAWRLVLHQLGERPGLRTGNLES